MKKRKVLGLIMALLFVLSLTSCGKTGICDNCGQEEKLKQFVKSNGEEKWYCEDCYRMAKLFE